MRRVTGKPTEELQARLEMMLYQTTLDKDRITELGSVPRLMILRMLLSFIICPVDVLVALMILERPFKVSGLDLTPDCVYFHTTTAGLYCLSALLERQIRGYVPMYGETQTLQKMGDPSIQSDPLDPTLTLTELNDVNEKLKEIAVTNKSQVTFTSFLTVILSVAGLKMREYVSSPLVNMRFDWVTLYHSASWLYHGPVRKMTSSLRNLFFCNSETTLKHYLEKLAGEGELTAVRVHLSNSYSFMLLLLQTTAYELRKSDHYFYEIQTTLDSQSLSYFCLLQILQYCGFEILLAKKNNILVAIDKCHDLKRLEIEANHFKFKLLGQRRGAKGNSENPTSDNAIKRRREAVKLTWEKKKSITHIINNCLHKSPIQSELKVSEINYNPDHNKIDTTFTLIYTIQKQASAHRYFIYNALRILHEKFDPNVNIVLYDRERIILTGFQQKNIVESQLIAGLKKLLQALDERIQATLAKESEYEAPASASTPQPENKKTSKGKGEKHPGCAKIKKQAVEFFNPERLAYTISTRPIPEAKRRNVTDKDESVTELTLLETGKIYTTKEKYLRPLRHNSHWMENAYLFFNKKSKALRKLKSDSPFVYKQLKDIALNSELGRENGIEALLPDKVTYWVRKPGTKYRLVGRFEEGKKVGDGETLNILHISGVTTHL